MRERRCWRFDALFGCDFQSAFECELNLASRFLTRISVRHDAGPLDDLSDEAFVAFFRRVPNADFVIARIGLHGKILPAHMPRSIGNL